MVFKRRTKEQRFWEWFVKNSDRLFDFESDRETIFDELGDEMHKVETCLTFEFSSIDDGKREFIVSADRIREAFPAVRNLVASAPCLERWIVIPFRPPKNITEVRLGDYSLGADDIWFSHEADGDRTGLTLFIQGLSTETESIALNATFLLLDAALGEFDVEEKVGFIERNPLPPNPEGQGLLPFSSIRKVFDSIYH